MAGRLLLWRGSIDLTCRLVQRSARARSRAVYVLGVRCHPAISTVSLVSPTEHTTQLLAGLLAQRATLGDCFCLYGDVGVGKSVFSRAFIRSIADDPALPVPSPTYLLLNTYDEHEGPPVHHLDLYRLAGPSDLGRLNLEETFASGICLIEWAERLEELAPAAHLGIHLTVLSQEEQERMQCHSGTEEHACPASSKPAEEDDRAEDADSAYVDTQWRHIALVSHEHTWTDRLQDLAGAACRAGLHLLPKPGERM